VGDFENIIKAIGVKPYYQDEWCAIYHADCRLVLPLIPDKSIDLVLTDPPYGVGKDYLGDYMDVRGNGYYEFMKQWYEASRRLTELQVFTPGSVNLAWWLKNYEPLWVACWYKSNACSTSKLGGVTAWEPILVYGKLQSKPRRDAWNIPITIQPIEAVGIHIVPKSMKMWSILVVEFSINEDILLDPFLGSGTTCYCAKKLNRYSIGIEIEEKYCEIAAKRCCQTVMKLEV